MHKKRRPITPDRGGQMPDHRAFYAQTMPGFEKIAWLEIRSRLRGSSLGEYLFARERNGIVVFEYDGPVVDLKQLRTTEDVFAVAVSAGHVPYDPEGLHVISRLVAQGDLLASALAALATTRKLSPATTWRLVARLEGQHRFRRRDFADAVARGLERRLASRWRRVDDDARVEFWANLLGSRLLVGVRLTDRAMRHRAYEVAHVAASLRPSAAAAMVWLSNPEADDVFLDPMCGGGTILAERLIHGRCRQVIGGDVDAGRTAAAVRNIEAAGAGATVRQWDAGDLPLAAGSVTKVATNPPFGRQVGSRVEVEKLYPRFVAEINRVLTPGGRAVILTSEFDLLRQVLRAHPSLVIAHGYPVAVLGQWGRLYVIERI